MSDHQSVGFVPVVGCHRFVDLSVNGHPGTVRQTGNQQAVRSPHRFDNHRKHPLKDGVFAHAAQEGVEGNVLGGDGLDHLRGGFLSLQLRIQLVDILG